MVLKLPLWTLIPALMLFTLIYFVAFENYTAQEWLIGNGIVSCGVGLVYGGESIYKKYKEKW